MKQPKTKRTLKRKKSSVKHVMRGANTLKKTPIQHGGVEKESCFNLNHVQDYIKINEKIIANIKKELKKFTKKGGSPTESGYSSISASGRRPKTGTEYTHLNDFEHPGTFSNPMYGKVMTKSSTQENSGSLSKQMVGNVPLIPETETNSPTYVNIGSIATGSDTEPVIYNNGNPYNIINTPENHTYEEPISVSVVENNTYATINNLNPNSSQSPELDTQYKKTIPLNSLTENKLKLLLDHYTTTNKNLYRHVTTIIKSIFRKTKKASMSKAM